MKAIENSAVNAYLKELQIFKEIDVPIGIKLKKENDDSTLLKKFLIFPSIQVTRNSPAEKAGLKNDQRIVAVNRRYVNNELARITDIIESIYNEYFKDQSLSLIVFEPEDWNLLLNDPSLIEFEQINNHSSHINLKLKSQHVSAFIHSGERVSSNQNCKYLKEKCPIFEFLCIIFIIIKASSTTRSCRLFRQNLNQPYGLEIKCYKGKTIYYQVAKVDNESPAEIANLKVGDYILEVNGEKIYGSKLIQIENKIFSNPNQIYLLVAHNIEDFYLNKFPGTRLCKLDMRPELKGFDFVLKEKHGLIQIRDVKPNSIASLAGIKNKDFILMVNKTSLIGETLLQVKSLMKILYKEEILRLIVIESDKMLNLF